MSNAESISIKEALELLDGPYSGVSAGVAQGQYALWLGSGVSRDRVIGLNGILAKLLECLRQRVTDDPKCGYRAALEKIIGMSMPSPDEQAAIDLGKPVEGWPCLPNLLKRLWRQYSTVLSITVPGHSSDFLLWDVLDFSHTFGCQEPDVEHLAIGMLALEGVTKEIATTNWDGLLEGAMKELCHREGLYRTTVTGDDLRNPDAKADLYKFHGCALRAIQNENEYRSLLIARAAQITGWNNNGKFAVIRNRLTSLIQTKRTLMIGMSAQDADIKQLFSDAATPLPLKWNEQPTPVVFSEQDLRDDEKELLALAYGEQNYEAHCDEICRAARLQAYAKPLLLALLLYVLCTKLEVLAKDANAPNLDVTALSSITTGIKLLRDRVASCDSDDRIGLVRSIALGLARARYQLQDGTSDSGPLAYFPIDDQPAHLMAGKLALKSTGQREAAVALGLIGIEEGANTWETSVDDPTNSQSGALGLTSRDTHARIFLAANDDTITNLLECGAFEETDGDVVVICSGRLADRQQRSPSGNWRTGIGSPRYLAFGPMLHDAANLEDLRERFRGEVGL